MKVRKYVLSGLLCACLAAASLSVMGCSKDDDNTPVKDVEDGAVNRAHTIEQQKDDVTEDGIKNDAVIMMVGDTKITYSEVLVYMLMLKQQYEPVFTDKIWDFSVGDEETFEDMAKDEIINQIARLKIMGFKASSLDVSLNADEKLDIENDAVRFLQNITMEDQEKYGITQNIVETIYTDNYLAQKVFDVATADVDTNVTDADATAVIYRQIKLVFNGTDKEGNVLEGTDEQKDKALQRINVIYDSIVNKGKDFDYYANRYSDASSEETSAILGDNEEAVETALFSLKKGEYSQVVEGDNAYYLFYCVDDNDRTNLIDNRNKIVERRRDKAFNQTYSGWLGEYDTYIVTELWNIIHFPEL